MHSSYLDFHGYFLRMFFCRVGIQNPTIEVWFEHLTINMEVYVGKQGVPTFTNFFSNKVMVCIVVA
jgi:hypothetical protein